MGIYLLLGSNVGDKRRHLERARQAIGKTIGNIKNASSLYVSQPWGHVHQPEFINQALELEFDGEATQLLAKILEVETQIGRKRGEKWGPRTIDIDILYFGNEIHISTLLTVPHPELSKRRFALMPLCEIALDFVHPVLEISNRQLLRDCADNLKVKPDKKGSL